MLMASMVNFIKNVKKRSIVILYKFLPNIEKGSISNTSYKAKFTLIPKPKVS